MISHIGGLKLTLPELAERFTEDELRDLLFAYLSLTEGLEQLNIFNPELFKNFCLEKIRDDRLNQILGENDESN